MIILNIFWKKKIIVYNNMNSYGDYLNSLSSVEHINEYFENLKEQRESTTTQAEEMAGILFGKDAAMKITQPLLKAGLKKLGFGDEAAEHLSQGNFREGIKSEFRERTRGDVEPEQTSEEVSPDDEGARPATVEESEDVALPQTEQLATEIPSIREQTSSVAGSLESRMARLEARQAARLEARQASRQAMREAQSQKVQDILQKSRQARAESREVLKKSRETPTEKVAPTEEAVPIIEESEPVVSDEVLSTIRNGLTNPLDTRLRDSIQTLRDLEVNSERLPRLASSLPRARNEVDSLRNIRERAGLPRELENEATITGKMKSPLNDPFTEYEEHVNLLKKLEGRYESMPESSFRKATTGRLIERQRQNVELLKSKLPQKPVAGEAEGVQIEEQEPFLNSDEIIGSSAEPERVAEQTAVRNQQFELQSHEMENQAYSNIGDDIGNDTAMAITKTAAKSTAESVATEAGAETGAEAGLEEAGTAVEGIPIIGEILGPILQLAGAGLTLGLAARNKRRDLSPVINPSFQYL